MQTYSKWMWTTGDTVSKCLVVGWIQVFQHQDKEAYKNAGRLWNSSPHSQKLEGDRRSKWVPFLEFLSLQRKWDNNNKSRCTCIVGVCMCVCVFMTDLPSSWAFVTVSSLFTSSVCFCGADVTRNNVNKCCWNVTDVCKQWKMNQYDHFLQQEPQFLFL